MLARYRQWWRETPGVMTLAHYCSATSIVTMVLLLVKPLWGFGAVLFWLVSTAVLARICVAWDWGVDMIEPKPCYDGRHCGNEDLMEDLAEALGIAVAALRQYAAGKTWSYIAIEALEKIEEMGLVEAA